MARVARPGKTLSLRRNDRAIFLGATGSGKTTLARALMYGVKNVAVLDPKRTFTLPESWQAVTTDDMETVLEHTGPKPIIYRPGAEILDDPESVEWWFWWVYNRGHTLAYIDEAMMVTKESRPLRGYAACIQLGREKGIGVWSATQRPARVPIVLLSESEHMFAFRLRHPQDLARVADYSSPEIMSQPASGHGFWYWNDRRQHLQYFRRADIGKELEAL